MNICVAVFIDNGKSSAFLQSFETIIKTAIKTYTLYNVKGGAEVWTELKHICKKSDSQSKKIRAQKL